MTASILREGRDIKWLWLLLLRRRPTQSDVGGTGSSLALGLCPPEQGYHLLLPDWRPRKPVDWSAGGTVVGLWKVCDWQALAKLDGIDHRGFHKVDRELRWRRCTRQQCRNPLLIAPPALAAFSKRAQMIYREA